MIERIPTIYCQSSLRTWYFHCPYCRTLHIHAQVAGHHHALCRAKVDSPYKATGYNLQGIDRRARQRAARYARRVAGELS
jgi:hypothetical protein